MTAARTATSSRRSRDWVPREISAAARALDPAAARAQLGAGWSAGARWPASGAERRVRAAPRRRA